MLLAPDVHAVAAMRPILGVTWIALLFVPLGYWGRGRSHWPRVMACLVAGAALFYAPGVTGLLCTPLRQLAAAGLGALFGLVSRRCLHRADRTSQG